MERGIGKVTTAGASLMCSLCGSQWEDHHPFTDEGIHFDGGMHSGHRSPDRRTRRPHSAHRRH